METSSKPWILDSDDASLRDWCVREGARPFVAGQILRWLFGKAVLSPEEFSDLSPVLRARLRETFRWGLPAVDMVATSKDGSQKFLLRLDDGSFVEMMLMPTDDRVTLCASSQVGCRMGCKFCQTGKLGLKRNMTSGEILAQIVIANAHLAKEAAPGTEARRVSNVVFMGMGEPLDNYDDVVRACRILTDEKFFGLSRHRVTISTVGLVEPIRRLGQDLGARLAISLHVADERERARLMPVTHKNSLEELKKALLEYPQGRHGITFEYVLIDGVNDSVTHAKKLVRFLHGLKAKVNLIPMNPHPGVPLQASQAERIREFQKYLSDRSIPAPVRYSRGQDIDGACGQLAAKTRGAAAAQASASKSSSE